VAASNTSLTSIAHSGVPNWLAGRAGCFAHVERIKAETKDNGGSLGRVGEDGARSPNIELLLLLFVQIPYPPLSFVPAFILST